MWQTVAGDEPPRYIDLVSDSRSFDRRFTVGLWCVDSRPVSEYGASLRSR